MSTTEIISALLTLTAGIGVFLIACTVMSTNLGSISSIPCLQYRTNCRPSCQYRTGLLPEIIIFR